VALVLADGKTPGQPSFGQQVEKAVPGEREERGKLEAAVEGRLEDQASARWWGKGCSGRDSVAALRILLDRVLSSSDL